MYAQDISKKTKWVKISGDTFLPDSSLIIPSSLKILIPSDSLLKISYDLHTGLGKIVYSQRLDSILIAYRLVPPILSKPYFKRDPAGYNNRRFYSQKRQVFEGYVPEKREELFTSEGLNKSGNISRGVSFGNNQNVFVNSVLNLQLEGKISEDVKITAVISDQNIPVQPEGNTQQLQQFDKVFIQLESKNARVTAGDIVMRSNASEFLKYQRNVQGGQGEVFFNKDSLHRSYTTAGVAIAKGRFNSMLFAPGQQDSLIEGVQGPYRLRGPKNERFIIILSNSEKVYVDGRLVQRGFDFDYVIDYNTAEITFTNRILITKFTRVRVDFEYSDRIFGRLITNAAHSQTLGKFSYSINYFQERDNPNNPLNVTLRDKDKLLLSQVGDSLNDAIASGVDSVGFFEGQILYKKDIIDGREVYVYSSNPDSAVYNVQFTFRGIGRGDYNQSNSSANGRVYQYVGQGIGTYAPVKVLATPKLQNMISAQVKYDLKPSEFIYTEVAQSKNDLNLYSKVHSEDDAGRSIKGGYINKGRRFLSSSDYRWNGLLDFEYNQKTFSAIDRFRAPEFERDWNENLNVKGDNYIFSAGVGLTKDVSNNISYKVVRRLKQGDLSGIQNFFQLNQKRGRANFLGNAFVMNNDKVSEKSHWQRYSINSFIETKFIVPGFIYSADKNIIESKATKEIIGSSMYYDEMKLYVRNSDSLGIKYFSDYSYRHDKTPLNGAIGLSSISQTSNTGISTVIRNNHEVGGTFTYRVLDNKLPSLTNTPDEETILSRLDLNSDILQHHLKSFLTVTAGTGRELQRQYLFIPSYNNNGNFIFVDFNKDGMKDLNEFVEKPYNVSDTTYIKTFVPTDQYTKAYYSTFNYRLDLTSPTNWRNSSGFKKIISKFSNVSSWNIDKKITDPNLWNRFSPFIENVKESDLLSAQRSVRSVLFFNRSNPQYGMDLNYLSTTYRQFLFQGFQLTSFKEYRWNGRVNGGKFFNYKLFAAKSTKTSLSDFLLSRNYQILSYKCGPEVSWQPDNTLRVSLNGAYTKKKNLLAEGNREGVALKELGWEVRSSKTLQRVINAGMKFILINNTNFGNVESRDVFSSPIAFEMMEGLQVGRNITWNIIWQEKLLNGLQLSINYEGRKSEINRVVHIGRMQISALF